MSGTAWSSKQMVGDRVKRRVSRMRAYKRIGSLEEFFSELGVTTDELRNDLETAADELRKKFDERQKLTVDIRSDMTEARRLTDDDILKMREALSGSSSS